MSEEMTASMTLARLEELVASYGADPERWPDDERRAGLELLASHPEASDITGPALALDQLLAALPTPAPANAALQDRLEAITSLPQESAAAPAAPVNQPSGGLFFGLFGALFGAGASRTLIPQAAALIMVCLASGVALGLSDFALAEEQAPEVDPSAYFFGNPGLDQDLEELD